MIRLFYRVEVMLMKGFCWSWRARIILLSLLTVMLLCIVCSCSGETVETSETTLVPTITATPTPTPSPTPTPTPKLVQAVRYDVTGGKKRKNVETLEYNGKGNMIHKESDIAGIKEVTDLAYDVSGSLRTQSIVRSISDRNRTTVTEITRFNNAGIKNGYEYHYTNSAVETDIELTAFYDDAHELAGLEGVRVIRDGSRGVEEQQIKIEYEYDGEGRLISEREYKTADLKRELTTTRTYEYTDDGLLAVETEDGDGFKLVTSYERNSKGLVVKEVSELSGLTVRARTTTTSYVYDGKDLLISMTVEEAGSFEKSYEYEYEYIYKEYGAPQEDEAA